MKKFLIGIIMILFSMGLSAQDRSAFWLTLNSINIKPTECDWSGWKPCNLNACFEIRSNRLWIYSPTLQKFNFIQIEKKGVKNELPQFNIIAKDINDKTCEIILWTDPDTKSYLLIRYLDGEYKYSIK